MHRSNAESPAHDCRARAPHGRAPSPRIARWLAPALVLALAAASLPGCQALYFIAGKGDQDALYTIPKNKRVLVFVDPMINLNVPPEFASGLGDKIGQHLFQYANVTKLVSQERLTGLRRNTPGFASMGIADVAKATDADIVVYVQIIAYDVHAISDNSLAQGDAQVLTKVVDSSGKRLWPTNNPTGMVATANVAPAFTSERDIATINKQLIDQLALHVGRMYHKYSLDDAEMTK